MTQTEVPGHVAGAGQIGVLVGSGPAIALGIAEGHRE
jgi:hypothetical protein